MKECSICKAIKDESEFHVCHRNKDGSVSLRNECKICYSIGEMDRYHKKQKFIDSKNSLV